MYRSMQEFSVFKNIIVNLMNSCARFWSKLGTLIPELA